VAFGVAITKCTGAGVDTATCTEAITTGTAFITTASGDFATAGPDCGTPNWATTNNLLYYKGKNVVLHGIGTSCMPNLIKGLGEKCFATYDWNDKANIITNLNEP